MNVNLHLRIPGWRMLAVLALILIAAGGDMIWWINRNATAANPFSARTIASVNFPLYYPNQLPAGYSIDRSTVREPDPGKTVVFTIKGPHNGKIYVSEVARPGSYDIGGFYKRWTDMRQIPVSDGAVATGRIGLTRIASRANNTTWIIANTNDAASVAQLGTMLKSISRAY